MNQLLKSPEFLNKRRFFTFLPVIIVPFATLLFVLLGGGKGITNHGISTTGINTELPDAKNDTIKPLNKMSFYEKATADSNRLAQQSKTDPYYSANGSAAPQTYDRDPLLLNSHRPEPDELEVYQKLEQLNKVLNQPEKKFADQILKNNPPPGPAPENSAQIQQLSSMMATMEEEKPDPELGQLQQLLEKIQQIQHPELLKQKSTIPPPGGIKKIYTTIPAIIANDQKIKQGTVVALTLLDSVVLNGQHIPKGHQVYGSCEISNQRISLHIKSIRLDYAIIPVDLVVYDLRDSMEGINAPEAVITDALKEGSDNAIQSLQLMAMEQNLSTQLAGAGITTAKGLFGKKIKRIKARLKAGYQVLLKDNQSH